MSKFSVLLRIKWGFLSVLPISWKRRALFRRNHGYSLPRQPKTFSEKIQWRMIHDRRELIAVGGDKIRMKEYASCVCPELPIPETLWWGEDLKGVAQHHWGCDWILKPIAGSGYAVFGTGSVADAVDIEDLLHWRPKHAALHGEWAYSTARPGYLIEKRIEMVDGGVPADYKFYVFAGRVEMIYFATPRSEVESHRFYSPDWTPLDIRRADVPLAPVTPRPESLTQMLEYASRLGEAYDFVRIDLFDADGKIYFGEISPYPAGGLRRFLPDGTDLKLGEKWVLPRR